MSPEEFQNQMKSSPLCPNNTEVMSDRKPVVVHYSDAGVYFNSHDKIEKIIQDDTGADVRDIPSTHSIPPMLMPPPLTASAISQLRKVEGMDIREVDEE